MGLNWFARRGRGTSDLRVLMVCTGNICRSPTAQGVLQARLRAAGLQDRVEVDSAGTMGLHAGEPPDVRAQQHARRRGVEIGGQRARKLVPADFSLFHYVLAMDRANLDAMAQVAAPRPHGPPRLLLALAADVDPGQEVQEVPDPYYGGPEGFEQVLDLIERGCDGLLVELQRALAARAAAVDPGVS